MYYGYLSDNFDQKTAKGLILDFAQGKKFLVSDFLVGESFDNIKSGDVLLVPSLSYFGLNLLKSLAGCVSLAQNGVEIIFIEQPELSICGENFDKTLAMFKSMLAAEKGFISNRVRAGQKAAKQKGAKLGRPKGSAGKSKILDNYRSEILGYVQKGVSTVAIMKIINSSLDKAVSYFTFRNYVEGLRS
jgi:DNA invertase Pin-like site-specific DNA recombinase